MSGSSIASYDYLTGLPGTTFRRLYQQPSTALAIFRRMLPPLAKSFVMAMLYMSKPLPVTDLDLWVHPNSNQQRDLALSVLDRLHIVVSVNATKETPQALALTKNFGASLRLALTGGGEHQSFGVPSHDSPVEGMDTEFLDSYATSKWEDILHYVVNSVGDSMRQEGNGPMASVRKLLEAGQLVTTGRRAGGGITKEGFSFLLQEVNAQVWTLLLLWINNAEHMDQDSVEVLSFLFMLGSLELSRGYSKTKLTETQQVMLQYLVDFGLVYIPAQAPDQFFPTRLATTLTSDASALRSVAAGFDAALSAASGTKGFIIIETNYRLYAYTDSPLQIAVLSLFTRLGVRYPNMVTGRITRKSVANAIAHGITSDQIITYLSTHAHPQLVKQAAVNGTPVLPPTVVDQIRLWQIENERMKASAGFLFKEFESQKEFEGCALYADQIGVLIWRNNAKRMFFVTRHEQLRDYIKARKNKES